MICCWFTQSILAWNLDADRSISRLVRKHWDSCPNCRHFYQSQTNLIRELTAAAPPVHPTPFLPAGILRALEETEAPIPSLRGAAIPSLAGVWAVGLAALAVLATIAWLRLSATRPEPDLPAMASLSLPAATHLAGVNGQKLIALGSTLETPLKREMQFLVSDAKNAINSLALTCLPAKAADVFGVP